jgi:hypothetical protein
MLQNAINPIIEDHIDRKNRRKACGKAIYNEPNKVLRINSPRE